jgi:hypothetical protein
MVAIREEFFVRHPQRPQPTRLAHYRVPPPPFNVVFWGIFEIQKINGVRQKNWRGLELTAGARADGVARILFRGRVWLGTLSVSAQCFCSVRLLVVQDSGLGERHALDVLVVRHAPV